MIDPSISPAAGVTGTFVYIVTDTKGAGRVVGAFMDRERAESIRGVDKAYFRLTALPVDSVNPVAIEWLLSHEQRELLRHA